ncbi:MAG TPA: YbjN domain-containing protein [Nitrospinota bacterium]|nr:YbjN domain-containing protein [Nitrospinota bacterium]
MSKNMEKVKNYLQELGFSISTENKKEELVVINDEEKGINNLIIDCEEPILVIEQIIMEVPGKANDFFKRLLQMNRTVVHGAFVVDEDGKNVIFRDTLQLENLDKNELEGSINSLSLALAEYANELISFSKS